MFKKNGMLSSVHKKQRRECDQLTFWRPNVFEEKCLCEEKCPDSLNTSEQLQREEN